MRLYNRGMKIVAEKDVNIGEIIKVLNEGEIVILPTETVYITAIDATNPKAVETLCKYKNRPLGKPFSVAVANLKMAEKYVTLNQTARDLYKKFLPGPVTVVSKGKHAVAPGIESELGTLGIRIPNYPLVLKICQKLGRPITATSANASYQRRPYKIADIWDNVSTKQQKLLTLAIDAGELPHNEPSTVIDTTLDDVVVLRQGEIKLKDKNEVFSRSEENTQNVGKELWQKYEKYAGSRAIIFALEGEMGAGKTQFTKGLAKTMGIKETVVSPTFNLNIQYSVPNVQYNFDHIDAWRMTNGLELEELGLQGLIDDKTVMAIEWADRVADTIRKYNEEAIVVWVKINYGPPSLKLQKGEYIENMREISWGSL